MVKYNILVLVMCFFKPFGLVPYSTISKVSNQLDLQRLNVAIILGLLIVYWTAVIKSFWMQTINKDMMSKVSNWMQLIINTIALTTVLLRPIVAAEIFKEIYLLLLKIDGKLDEFPMKIKKKQCFAIVIAAIAFFVFYMTFLISFDYYVMTIRHKAFTKTYWSITIFPMIVYSAVIWYAFCLFISIYFRIKHCNKILKHEFMMRLVWTRNFNSN